MEMPPWDTNRKTEEMPKEHPAIVSEPEVKEICGWDKGCGWASDMKCQNEKPCREYGHAEMCNHGDGKPSTQGCHSAGSFVCGTPVCSDHPFCKYHSR